MRALIRFGKRDRLRFISHLDLQRFFQRAVNRTGLPVAWSQGFNPHPVMSFGSALALGWTSEYEVIDIKLSAPMGRSCFYTIGACAAATIYVTQTILNVFGTVDLLPLTGVTFPFVSNGGSSMLAVWGLLAFIKAADTRQNASFAIKLPPRKEALDEQDI